MKLKKVYEEAKNDVKRRILDDVLILFPVTFLVVCMAITSCENIIAGEAGSAVMNGIMAFVSVALWISVLNKMIKYVTDKIEHLWCVAEVDNTYKEIDIKACKCELNKTQIELIEAQKEIKIWKSRAKINGDDKSLEEILKEQENGDTKECECELEQGDTMS